MIPTSEPAKRMATIMRRRLTSHWSSPEIIAFRKLVKDKAFENLEDLIYVETYYAWNWKKEGNICRTSLLTLLRHFACEVDRARRWAELHPAQFRKSNPMLSPRTSNNRAHAETKVNTLSDEEWKSVAQMTREQLREFRKTWMKKHYDMPQNTISGQDDSAAKGDPPKEEPPAAQRAEEDSLLLPNL